MKQKLYLLAGFIFGGIFLYISTKDLNLSDFNYVFEHLNTWWILPLILAGTLFIISKAYRWKLLLQPVYNANLNELYSSIMIGSSVGYTISVYIGEVVRTFCFAKQCNVSKSSVLATIILERFFDLFILLIFFGIALIYTSELPFDGVKIGYIFTLMGLILFTLMMFAVFQTDQCLKVVHFLSSWLPVEIQKKVVKQINLGILGLHSLKSPVLLMEVILTSLIVWIFIAIANHSALLVVGVEAPFYASFLIMGLVVVGLSLPNPPGSIGIVEWCYVMGLRPYGIDTAAALAAAVVFHVIFYSAVILIGLLYARHMNLSLRQAAKQASSSE
jgi:uncharacterized protein (TIRG00374 family)